MAATPTISSPLCEALGIQHPILLAGMAVVSSPPLAAAVSNAGGLGVIGAGYPNPSPQLLKKQLDELDSLLDDKTCFGVDLLTPQVGGNARKTNYDYTKGAMPEMIDLICQSRCRLFVSAVGVPATWMVDKLHAAGIHVMSMIGSARHVKGVLAAGVDIVCAQGYEGGGHTGEVATMVLIPQVVDLCRDAKSPLTGKPVQVVAAGGFYDGRTLCAAFALGAQGVWMGTRFLAAEEATATKLHKSTLVKANGEDTMRSIIYTGRPARVYKSPYLVEYETKRRERITELSSKGILPYVQDLKDSQAKGKPLSIAETSAIAFGQCAGAINEIKPAAEIIQDIMFQATDVLKASSARLSAKL